MCCYIHVLEFDVSLVATHNQQWPTDPSSISVDTNLSILNVIHHGHLHEQQIFHHAAYVHVCMHAHTPQIQ